MTSPIATLRADMNEVEVAIGHGFQLALPALPGNAELRTKRQNAFAEFARTGLPGRRNEEWHYTDLRNMLPAPGLMAFEPLIQSASNLPDPLVNGVNVITIRNDQPVGVASLPKGVTILSLRNALATRPDLVERLGSVVGDSQSVIAALNTATFGDARFIVVDDDVEVTLPLHIHFHFSGAMRMQMVGRALLLAGNRSKVTLLHSVTGDAQGGFDANSVVEAMIGQGARVDYVRYNGASLQSSGLFLAGFRLDAAAELNMFNLTTGSALSRMEARVTFAGENAKAGIRGVNLLRGQQHADVTLTVDHQAPGCESRELFRHVVDGQATGVFQGKIMVHRTAQKTDGQMASNAILLSDDATMNNKPELEIFADDVVCAHGATCGALDDDLLFYLEARGLPRAEAEALMVRAFCGEAIEFVENEQLRDALNAIVEGWLKTRSGAVS